MFIILKQQKIPVLWLQTSTHVSFFMRSPVTCFQTIHFSRVDYCARCFTYAKPSLSTDFSPRYPWTQNTVIWFSYTETHIILGWINFSKTSLGCAWQFHAWQQWPSVLFNECMSVCGTFLVLSLVWGAPHLRGGMFKLGKLLFLILVLGIRLMQLGELIMCITQETCQNCNRSKGHLRTCVRRHRQNTKL
jgi:hypothetical protein